MDCIAEASFLTCTSLIYLLHVIGWTIDKVRSKVVVYLRVRLCMSDEFC
jgi:hypothetical protein